MKHLCIAFVAGMLGVRMPLSDADGVRAEISLE